MTYKLIFTYYDEKQRKFLTIYKSNKDIYVLKGQIEELKRQYKLNSYDITTK